MDTHEGVPRRTGGAAVRRRFRLRALIGAILAAPLLASCAKTATAPPSSKSSSAYSAPVADRLHGGVASYALAVGDDYSWIFPLVNEANDEGWDINPDNGMWRPLYYAATPGQTGIDYALSLANPPVYSDGDTAVTVTLKRGWTWSDGTPVTTADVRFFFQLEAAGVRLKLFAYYVPGLMPDDIRSVTYQGPYQFTIHLIHPYNPVWFTGNQLTWIVPLPEQAWDRTCATCTVGNDAATPAGADAVYKFLYGQSEDLSTYATNPLWQVVDGPWVIRSFDPTTYHVVFAANPRYTGPGKPWLAGYSIYSFSNSTAELDAVRAGVVDFGWLPFTDVAAAPYYRSRGFAVVPWPDFYNEAMEFGYTGPWKTLVDQLYIRQALQHLVDEQLYLTSTLHGYGLPDYGVAPDYPGSPLVSPYLRHDPYPYSLSAAKALLASHGWKVVPGGVDTCERPGTGPTDCGAGITRGEPLSLSFMYSVGSQSFTEQVEAFQTAASAVGIRIVLNPQTVTSMFSIAGVCPPGPCDWAIAGYGGYMWDFGQGELVPTGAAQFGAGNYWAGGYDSREADRLIAQAHEKPGLKYLYADEDYLTKDVASLWWPVSDFEIVLATNRLKGWYPLNPYGNYHPSAWYFVKSS